MSDFTKYQALGNDYLVVDAERWPAGPELARALCDRHYGVGADGVLFGSRPTGAGPIPLQIRNSDGSPCDRSANGIRMYALQLAEQQPERTGFVIRTAAGDTAVRLLGAGRVSAELGRSRFEEEGIPSSDPAGTVFGQQLEVAGESVRITCVDNGNPHAVVFVDELDADRARRLGPLIVGHPRFPERRNVEFVRVLDRGSIEIEIVERGAGYTLASGSGACAARTKATSSITTRTEGFTVFFIMEKLSASSNAAKKKVGEIGGEFEGRCPEFTREFRAPSLEFKKDAG